MDSQIRQLFQYMGLEKISMITVEGFIQLRIESLHVSGQLGWVTREDMFIHMK